jgi:hypothetical protein
MKMTMRFLAVVVLIAVTSWQNTMPAHAAYSNPAYDITGVWSSSITGGATMQVFQEKDLVNAIVVDKNFAHRLAGRYFGKTQVRMILIRRDRNSGCEMTFQLDLTVNSNTSILWMSTALETACGINSGQTFSYLLTRTA